MSVPNSYLRHVTPRRSYIRQGPPLLSPVVTKQDLLTGNLTERLLSLKVKREKNKAPLLRAQSHARDLCAALELKGFHQGLHRADIGDFFGRDVRLTNDQLFVAKLCCELRDKLEEACGISVRFDGAGIFRLLKDNEAMAVLNMHLTRLAGDTNQLSQLSVKQPAATVYSLYQRPIFGGEDYGHAAD